MPQPKPDGACRICGDYTKDLKAHYLDCHADKAEFAEASNPQPTDPREELLKTLFRFHGLVNQTPDERAAELRKAREAIDTYAAAKVREALEGEIILDSEPDGWLGMIYGSLGPHLSITDHGVTLNLPVTKEQSIQIDEWGKKVKWAQGAALPKEKP